MRERYGSKKKANSIYKLTSVPLYFEITKWDNKVVGIIRQALTLTKTVLLFKSYSFFSYRSVNRTRLFRLQGEQASPMNQSNYPCFSTVYILPLDGCVKY